MTFFLKVINFFNILQRESFLSYPISKTRKLCFKKADLLIVFNHKLSVKGKLNETADRTFSLLCSG
jgi:hypothetical protein